MSNENVSKKYVLGGLDIIKRALAIGGIELALAGLMGDEESVAKAEGYADALKLIVAFEGDIKDKNDA